MTVKVFAPGLGGRRARCPPAACCSAGQLRQAEVDLAARPRRRWPSRPAVGRTLARPLPAGAAGAPGRPEQRQWFAAGDTVQVVARGQGFSVSGEGQALSPGIEGQPVRVRTDSGRVLSGLAVGRNRVEVQL